MSEVNYIVPATLRILLAEAQAIHKENPTMVSYWLVQLHERALKQVEEEKK